MNQESFSFTERLYESTMKESDKLMDSAFLVDKTDHHDTVLDNVIFRLQRDQRELNVTRKVLDTGKVQYRFLSMGDVPFRTHPRQASQMLFTKLESLLPKHPEKMDFIDAAILLDDLLIEYNKEPKRGSLSISN